MHPTDDRIDRGVLKKVNKYGGCILGGGSFSSMQTSKVLTPSSWMHSKRLPSVLQASRLRSVLALSVQETVTV